MNLPDRIFAIGGAGKAIAYELLEAEWVLDSVLRPRPNPKTVSVTLVDTAQEEENRDLERIRELEERIEKKKRDLRDEHGGRPGEINIDYLPLTRNIQLLDQNDLIGEKAVPRIAQGKGMDPDDWWLEPEHINENLDFATGVVRKRGLGKAIYYKAYAEDDDVTTQVDLPRKGKVAVLAGLGGGTGSGLVLDLVRDLKKTQRTAEITLFGVLPNRGEGDRESANAHAALSEMEYLSIQDDEELFKDRILIPIDPTDFGGKTGNVLQSSDALIEFDRAAVYLIASYYNMMDMEDPFEDAPSYAPFTIGIPQVLRYNVDAIQEAKASLRELLDVKEDALQAEEEIYADIDRFLSKHWGVDSGSTDELHDSDIKDLENRLESIRAMVEFDLFEELEYGSVSIFESILGEAEQEGETVPEKIDLLQSSLRAGSAQVGDDAEQFVDSVDKRVAEILRKDINRIAFRKDLLERLRVIEISRVRDTLGYLLALNDSNVNAAVQLNQLEAKRDEAAERKDHLEEELEETREEIETIREEQSHEIERRLQDWEQAVQQQYQQYQRCREAPIEDEVRNLRNELDQFARSLADAEDVDQVESVSQQSVLDSVGNLEDELDDLDANFDETIREIRSSVKLLKDAKKAFLQSNTEPSLGEKLNPFGSDAEKERSQAQKNYRSKRNQINDGELFALSRDGDTLRIEVNFDGDKLVRRVDQEAERLEETITDELRAMLDGPGTEYVRRLEDRLQSGATMQELKDIVEEAVQDELEGTSEAEQRREELEAELEDVNRKVEVFDATVQLFEDLNSRRKSYVDSQASFAQQKNDFGEDTFDSISSEDEDYIYVKTIRPRDILQMTGDSNIVESNIFDNDNERQRLRGSLEELAENTHNPKYTGLKKRRLSSSRSRYDDMKVVVGVMSQAVEQISDEANLKPVFEGAFNIGMGDDRFASFPVDAGGSWDVGLGIFINGIFLDNLRNEVDAEGYYAGYRAREDTGDMDIRVHHTLGLDEGYYVRRTKLLNMENVDDVQFFLREETDINADLLDEYLERVELDGDDEDEAAAEEQSVDAENQD